MTATAKSPRAPHKHYIMPALSEYAAVESRLRVDGVSLRYQSPTGETFTALVEAGTGIDVQIALRDPSAEASCFTSAVFPPPRR